MIAALAAAAALTVHPPVLVQVRSSPDVLEIQRVCRELGAPPGWAGFGCGVVGPRVCTLYLAQPAIGVGSDLEIAGHELWHCIYPKFHGDIYPKVPAVIE